jgi:hypothetical protein
MPQHEAAERQGGLHTSDGIVIDGAFHAVHGLFARGAMHDQLGDHGVVMDGDGHALGKAVVHAHTGAMGQAVGGEGADVRQEVVGRVLGIHAHFNGMAVDPQVALAEGEFFALGHLDLFLHQVQSADHLRHGGAPPAGGCSSP